jgi:hypothetical protein
VVEHVRLASEAIQANLVSAGKVSGQELCRLAHARVGILDVDAYSF